MEEALRFLRSYEIWIYVLLALVGVIYIRKFILSWEELRGAAFGLEKESAQSRLNRSASMLVLLLVMGFAVFVMVSFIAPSIPMANPLNTPTLDILATATTTLSPDTANVDVPTDNGTAGTPQTLEPIEGEGCIPGQLIFIEPTDGAEVSGIVTLIGTVNHPNFGFYKYEVARPGDAIWLTIQAGKEIVQEGELGQWDTSALSPGEYLLRLVLTDNQGESVNPCIIRVYVNNP
jgi:hypothetical protein